ncbi:MAG: hypothetical protein ABL867_06195 [Rickettsiales bacterium]
MKKKPVTKKTKNLLAKGREYYSLAYKPRDMIEPREMARKCGMLTAMNILILARGFRLPALGIIIKN